MISFHRATDFSVGVIELEAQHFVLVSFKKMIVTNDRLVRARDLVPLFFREPSAEKREIVEHKYIL